MQFPEKRVRQINLMVVENLESGEYSAFLTNDPMNVKTSKSLKDAIVNLFLSIEYTNRENPSGWQ